MAAKKPVKKPDPTKPAQKPSDEQVLQNLLNNAGTQIAGYAFHAMTTQKTKDVTYEQIALQVTNNINKVVAAALNQVSIHLLDEGKKPSE